MIQKAFNSKDLRKKESKLRSKYNKAIRALTELNISEAEPWIKTLEEKFATEFTEVLRTHPITPIVNQEAINFDQELAADLTHLPNGAVETAGGEAVETAGKKKK